MEYFEALKKVRSEKPKDSFMVIQLFGDEKLVLPFKEGQTFLESLAHAEKFNSRWSPTRIDALDRDNIQITTMPHEEYERFKIAAILNLTPDEIRDLAKPTT